MMLTHYNWVLSRNVAVKALPVPLTIITSYLTVHVVVVKFSHESEIEPRTCTNAFISLMLFDTNLFSVTNWTQAQRQMWWTEIRASFSNFGKEKESNETPNFPKLLYKYVLVDHLQKRTPRVLCGNKPTETWLENIWRTPSVVIVKCNRLTNRQARNFQWYWSWRTFALLRSINCWLWMYALTNAICILSKISTIKRDRTYRMQAPVLT